MNSLFNPKGKRKSFFNDQSYSKLFFNQNTDFKCKNCQMQVLSEPVFSGVKHRNHCPYCLWSKHVDLKQAGDRLAACKGAMKPIALTQKHNRNKYSQSHGEIMLVHLCMECGAFSINRIATDDNNNLLLEIFKKSFHLDSRIKVQLEQSGIVILDKTCESQMELQFNNPSGLDSVFSFDLN